MKKINRYAILIALGLGVLVSCVKDEGNNKMSEINEITISGINDRYDLTSYLETLDITPVIDFSENDFSENDLEYSWFFAKTPEVIQIIITKK